MGKHWWEKHPCIDCGKPVCPGSLRCHPCATKDKANSERTKAPSNYCIGCGKKIFRGSTRCKSCRMKHSWKVGVLNASMIPRGEKNHSWRGGITHDSNGYCLLKNPNHPKANNHGYVREHILVWEQAHGEIPKGWIVHHLNGIPSDNRLSNLITIPDKTHKRILAAKARRIQELEALLKAQGQLF